MKKTTYKAFFAHWMVNMHYCVDSFDLDLIYLNLKKENVLQE